MDLRFSDGPASAMPGYLRVEDAVNALGRQDHPTEWGHLPGWALMPFRLSKKVRNSKGKRRYVRHTLTLVGKKGNLHSIPIKTGLNSSERRACVRLYGDVVRTLREPIETGVLRAVGGHHKSGKIETLDRSYIWRKQFYLIFYTGKAVLIDPPGPDVIVDVFIEKVGFERWLEARRKSQATATTRKVLEAIGRIIIEHGKQHGYDITLSEAWDLVDGVARQHNKDVSKREFKNRAWILRQSKAGRKKKKQKILEQHAVELRALIAERLGPPPTGEQSETVRCGQASAAESNAS